jgi:hypothetical protein
MRRFLIMGSGWWAFGLQVANLRGLGRVFWKRCCFAWEHVHISHFSFHSYLFNPLERSVLFC